ncbi:MAG: family 43 glycosylhydrolase, partial [Clostridia bacterium]|nr:family 43 glycosylhydrolase [Clostridia bacterium]
IHVAVSDRPDGPFRYHGCVRNPDGSPMADYITFDPAVINDARTIRLYYGTSLFVPPERLPEEGVSDEQLHDVITRIYCKKEEDLTRPLTHMMWANTVELDDDMLTICHKPRRIVPGQLDSMGTSFENHAFHEASSIRKIGDTYYFIYSSQHQHELCYATSQYPDRDFVYGGVIVDNGDIGYQGRAESERVMMTGNNHGSIEQINGQWYIFYHRQTHLNTFSRQGCAEKITVLPDGLIEQAEITSCGLNGGPLAAQGAYPASICCCLTNGHMPHIGQQDWTEPMPTITHAGESHFLSGISNGVTVGYKYFVFEGLCALRIACRGTAVGTLSVALDDRVCGEIAVHPAAEWTKISGSIRAYGSHALYFTFRVEGTLDIRELRFCTD